MFGFFTKKNINGNITTKLYDRSLIFPSSMSLTSVARKPPAGSVLSLRLFVMQKHVLHF